MRREDRRESDTSKGGRRRWREVNPRYVRHPKGRDRCSAAPLSACLRFLPSCIQDDSESSGVLRRNRSHMLCFSYKLISYPSRRIGGLHQALLRTSVDATVVRAFDWDQNACQVYSHQHSNRIENVPVSLPYRVSSLTRP
jgi:hypothetical protein